MAHYLTLTLHGLRLGCGHASGGESRSTFEEILPREPHGGPASLLCCA